MKLKEFWVTQNETHKMKKMSASTNKLSWNFAEQKVRLPDYRRQKIILYTILEEEIYMNIPKGMIEELKEHYRYKNIF